LPQRLKIRFTRRMCLRSVSYPRQTGTVHTTAPSVPQTDTRESEQPLETWNCRDIKTMISLPRVKAIGRISVFFNTINSEKKRKTHKVTETYNKRVTPSLTLFPHSICICFQVPRGGPTNIRRQRTKYIFARATYRSIFAHFYIIKDKMGKTRGTHNGEDKRKQVLGMSGETHRMQNA